MSRENVRQLFDSNRQYVVSMNSMLPSLDGSQLYNIKPASVRIAFTDSASDHVLWNLAGTAAVVTHSLNCYPVVTVWDNNGMQLFPTITVLSATSFKMDFEYNVVINQQEPWYCIINYGGEYGTGTDDGQELEPSSSSSSSDSPSGSMPAPIIGNSDPTTSTVGVPGQTYYNESSDKAFLCIRLASSETPGEILYIWKEIGAEQESLAWGNITGTLSDQTDLASALAAKADLVNDLIPSSELPVATASTIGGVKVSSAQGVMISDGVLAINRATNTQIDNKNNSKAPIVPVCLNYAVRSVVPNVTVIPASTTAFDLLDATATTNNHSWNYRHAPTSAPTYTLPSVTDTTVEHYIVIDVDFTTVQTCAFEDSSENIITPLNGLSIQAGDIVEYLCKYDSLQSKWVIVASFLNKPNTSGGGGGSGGGSGSGGGLTEEEVRRIALIYS